MQLDASEFLEAGGQGHGKREKREDDRWDSSSSRHGIIPLPRNSYHFGVCKEGLHVRGMWCWVYRQTALLYPAQRIQCLSSETGSLSCDTTVRTAPTYVESFH